MSADGSFELAFADVLEDVLGWDRALSDSDSPATVEEWDSLAQVRLVHELEDRFSIRLPDEALLERRDVGSLKALVLEHVR